jgi:hypothetical protein
MSGIQKTHKRRRSRNRIKSWLARPILIQVASSTLRLIDVVARAIDWFW